ISRGDEPRHQPLKPYSNWLYFMDYAVIEPVGSGAPEEMFYRGFLQNEFKVMTNSSVFSILATSALFAFSHEPGDGRYSAAVAGMYLGYLEERYHGNLGPGITLHYWSSIFLGIESVLLSQWGQRATPPAGMSIQISY